MQELTAPVVPDLAALPALTARAVRPARAGTARHDQPSAGRAPATPAGNDESAAGNLSYNRQSFVFFSALVGRPVLDAAGRPVGSVRDLAVRIRDPYPPVTTLVVGGRRRGPFAVPWQSVAACGPSQIRLLPGDLDRFGPPAFPPDEAPLRQAVLDKQIVDMHGAKVVRVNDLHLVQVENVLRVAHVDIGVRGLLRRLGLERAMDILVDWLFSYRLAERFIAWKYVQLVPLAYSHGVQFSFPIQKLSQLHPADLAEIVEDLSIHQGSRILTSLDLQTAAQTLSEVDPEVQTSIIEVMDRQQASDIIEEMPAEEAADLLGELREEVAEDVLDGFEEGHAEEVRELLAYDEDTAGGLMSPDFFCLPQSVTVEEALDRIRQAHPESDALPYVYLVDAHSRLTGVVSLRELILGRPAVPVARIMERRLVSVRPDADPREVMDLLVKYNLRAVPVVDETASIKGVIRLQEAFTAVFPEAEGE